MLTSFYLFLPSIKTKKGKDTISDNYGLMKLSLKIQTGIPQFLWFFLSYTLSPKSINCVCTILN